MNHSLLRGILIGKTVPGIKYGDQRRFNEVKLCFALEKRIISAARVLMEYNIIY
jgi:hypothetical protein